VASGQPVDVSLFAGLNPVGACNVAGRRAANRWMKEVGLSYTHTALALVWLLLMGLFWLAGSGIVSGAWLILLIVAALVMPALISSFDAKVQTAPGRDVAPPQPVRLEKL